MKKKDYICMSALMLIFAIMAFFRLGTTHVPETTYHADRQNSDIIIDVGEYLSIGSIDVFLGNLHDRKLSISVYNEVKREWEVINNDVHLKSVFRWNEIPIHYKVRYIGIVAMDEEAVFNEMVVKLSDGTPILPVNSANYETLFDEQDTYPEDSYYYNNTIFDEIYHGRTAYEFLHGIHTYETTHPHLGKILISIGIALFGMNPFGWRFMSVIFGILMVGVMYLFAKRLFGSTFIATMTAGLLTFDCMHYTLSRIATIDIFIAFFILLMYYFLYEYFIKEQALRFPKTKKRKKKKNQEANAGVSAGPNLAPENTRTGKEVILTKDLLLPLALCGVSMAFGVATKFTGVYAGIGLGILFIWYTLTYFPKKQVLKLFLFCCLFFVLIPVIVYVLTFIPVVTHREYANIFEKAYHCTINMYNYHANLEAEHYYSSPFYEWPVIWMPLLYADDDLINGLASSISCMGNPAIWWPGIACFFFILYRYLFKRDRKAGFLLIAYLAQYVPWMGVGRITFIYHYLPAILFTMLMMGYVMHLICEKIPRYGARIVSGYMLIVVFVFFMFFPVISGYPVKEEWGLSLRWLKDWILVL